MVSMHLRQGRWILPAALMVVAVGACQPAAPARPEPDYWPTVEWRSAPSKRAASIPT